MDTNHKLKEIREEFREYLTEKHPEWTENTINTHVSDAYYIWNNTVIQGFWKVFISDESMNAAKESICDHLKNSVKSERYKERTDGYFRSLKLMKEFFDSEFGGVANRIGEELFAEEVIYQICKKQYG